MYRALPSCKGRFVIGYTNIVEDSYTPITRLSYTPYLSVEPLQEESSKRPNPWISSENKTNELAVYQRANKIIDSLNNVALVSFKSQVNEKLNRPIAMRSDVIGSLKRAATFLNEFQGCPRILIVCSDFKDTYGQSMVLDPTINLFIVGSNVNPKDVKAATGVEKSGYRLFESYEETINEIIYKYMSNPLK